MNTIGMMIFFLGVMVFAFGLHDIDNAWNLHTVREETGLNYLDNSLIVKGMDEYKLYDTGSILVFTGFVVSILGCFLASYEYPKRSARKSPLPYRTS